MQNTKSCWLQYPNQWSAEACMNQTFSGTVQTEEHLETAQGHIYQGDNLPLLHLLLPQFREQVDLIYIDPPFGTGQNFANLDQEVAYQDQLVDHEFLEFLRRRLFVMREWLSPRGSLYLHIDKKIGHYVKLILDEVFGQQNFLNDISRIKCNPKNFSRKAYGNYSDMILFYAKNRDQHIWNKQREPHSEADLKRLFPKTSADGRPYTTHPLHAPGETLHGDTGQAWKGLLPPKGRHWRYSREVLDQLEEAGLIEWSDTGNPRKIVFATDHPGKKIQDVWTFKDKGLSYVSYPTEKNHGLLERIILQSSAPDSWVLDAFAGSGGTLKTAGQLGRRWIGMDQSPQSHAAIRKNLADAGLTSNWFRYVEKLP
ncbi:MAG: site-specific DNA-methyltransferase [Bacteroidota bacterium]